MTHLMALVNTDFPKHPALDLATRLLSDRKGVIDVVTAIPSVPSLVRALWAKEAKDVERELLTEKQSALNALIELQSTPDVSFHGYVLHGKPFVEIIHLAHKRGATMVITDTSFDRHEEESEELEDTNFRLLRKCPCPVWLIQGNAAPVPRRIAAAVDVQDTDKENLALNVKILDQAGELAKRYGAQLNIVQAWELFGDTMVMRKYGMAEYDHARAGYLSDIESSVNELVDHIKAQGVECEIHLINGPPENAIPHFVDEGGVDLVVMGTVGRSGIPGFIMGNTAEKILNRCHSSILALKPDGFHSPVL